MDMALFIVGVVLGYGIGMYLADIYIEKCM